MALSRRAQTERLRPSVTAATWAVRGRPLAAGGEALEASLGFLESILLTTLIQIPVSD